MPKLYSSKQITKTLKNHGFDPISQKGSHGKFRKTMGKKVLTAIVPMGKREIPAGTFSSILRQSQLNKEDFE
ncbi:type II toxin-antitoxin system HicA family toxin [Candidatus Daviesbacteria bacterium]|nr:type II toxin-antitoxin system HicA family toxin [Candidatus Daviesbacteria bacterium]